MKETEKMLEKIMKDNDLAEIFRKLEAVGNFLEKIGCQLERLMRIATLDASWRFGQGMAILSLMAISVLLVMNTPSIDAVVRSFSAITILSLMLISAHYMDKTIQKRNFWDGLKAIFGLRGI